jgi:DNA-binding CsgD family transcriptional regulator
MDEQARVDHVIANLYAGTLESSAWNRAMDGIVAYIDCAGAVLFATNPTTRIVLRDEVYGFDPSIMRAYSQDWLATDMRVTAGLAVPVGEPHHERQTVSKGQWEHSALLNEFLLPVDAPFMLATWLHKSAHKTVALTLEGSKRRRAFDEVDIRRLKRLIPHVQRALEIRDRLEAHEVRASALTSVVEQSHIGVIMLDNKGRILDATGLAEQLLKAECGMRRASDHALWLREPAGSQLREWVMTGLPPKDSLQGCLSVPRDGGLQSISLVVTPMTAVPVAWTLTDPRWLVFVFDPERRVAPVAELISRELGISTREGEIAVLLSLGHTLSSIATRLGISLHTVRVHLKHIFEKTGVHSQSELIRRVLLSPAIHLAGKH